MVKVMETDKKIAICQSLLLKPDGSIDSSGDFIDDLDSLPMPAWDLIDIKKFEMNLENY